MEDMPGNKSKTFLGTIAVFAPLQLTLRDPVAALIRQVCEQPTLEADSEG